MRNKTIISTAAFIVAFVLSVGFASLFIDQNEYQSNIDFDRDPVTAYLNHGGNYTAHKIEVFLRHDERNAQSRDKKVSRIARKFRSSFTDSSFTKYADGISAYADDSGNMNADDLPQEFQTAWRAHIKAWRDYADFLDGMKNSSVRPVASKEDFNIYENQYNDEIESTWLEVLRVADDYGSDFH